MIDYEGDTNKQPANCKPVFTPTRTPLFDNNRFRYFADEPLPQIPKGTVGHIELKTAREIYGERQRWFESACPCPTCEGKGRVSKSDSHEQLAK